MKERHIPTCMDKQVYEVSAKTIPEAYAKANELYGGEDKEITCEIISEPKKGLFGIGSRDAVIRVTVAESETIDLGNIFTDGLRHNRQADEEEKGRRDAGEKQPENKKNADGAEKKEPHEKKEPDQGKKDGQNRQHKGERPEKKEAQREKRSADRPAQPRVRPEQRPEQKKEEDKEPRRDDDRVKTGVSEDEMKYALEFLRALMADMGLSAEAEAAPVPEDVEFEATEAAPVYPAINISGDDQGVLIGHHGETLDAIQFLVNLSAQRRTGGRGGKERVKIKIDVENYRSKREETLRILARKMAGRAVKYRKNMYLEPMNPYERRIIHSELQSYPGVSTHSVGSDKNRKIVISYEGK